MNAYGSGLGNAAVLLTGFAINWSGNKTATVSWPYPYQQMSYVIKYPYDLDFKKVIESMFETINNGKL